MGTNPTVTLIDLSHLFWTAWHSSAEDGISAARERTLAAVRRCAGARPDSLIAVCTDVGRSFRKNMLPSYKANRPEKDGNALAEFERVRERLIRDGFWLVGADTYEADDVIATLTGAALKHGHEVLVCSADKDLLQLAQPGVTFLRTHDWSEWTEEGLVEKLGVPMSRYGDWLALVGDKSDNIPGLPGVGPVNATKIIAKYGSLAALWEASGNVTAPLVAPAIDKTIRTPGTIEQVSRARILVSLRSDAPVDFEQIYVEREVKNLIDHEDSDGTPTEEAPPEETAPRVQAPSTEATTQAIAVQADASPVPFELQLEPTSSNSAVQLARFLYESRLYPKLGRPEAILAVILRGRSIGLGAGAALDCFNVVEGRLCPTSHLIIARAKADRQCEYFHLVESTETSATWETKHRNDPKPTRMTYTVGLAKAAGVYKASGAWEKRPAEMCRKTAGAQLARAVYPEASLGLYAQEEFDE